MVNYPLNGTSGLVVGSMSPSLENYCIKCGVKKVYSLVLSDDFRYQGKYDFVLLFSGIEHTGLGAYGDPLDSLGDIREMQKIRCLLREGGLAFIGLPTGADGVQFNTKRIYGRGRLPLIDFFHRWLKVSDKIK
uniref:Class I SAM-dependent methyltransferase n=1 Tax=Syphacia muris TaxID=451379 RepID=A0A0N5AB51_9BILA